MGNFARKIIDAVQHSMLDKLVARLFPLLWIASLWEDLAPSESGTGFLKLLLVVGGLMALYWVLGAIADEPPKPRRQTPFDRLHEHSPSGFSAWDQPPEGGLRPPAPIRLFVMTVGVQGRSWVSLLEGLLVVGAFGLAWMSAYKSPTFWAGVHQGLADQASREQLFLAASVLLTGLLIRGWAVVQRRQLCSSPVPDHPILGSIILGGAFSAIFGMIVSDFLGYGLLPGVIGGPALLAVALLPPWREKVLEFLFGKREPADGRP